MFHVVDGPTEGEPEASEGGSSGDRTPATLLLLHGFPTCSWDWREVWEALTREFRVMALDFPGFGYSDKPRKDVYGFGRQTDVVEALLSDLDPGPLHVLAHDYGDTVAQEILARRLGEGFAPAWSLESVCLLNGGLFPEAIHPLPVQRLLESPLGRLVGPVVPRWLFRRAFSRVFGPDTKPSDEELDAYWRLLVRDGGRRVVHRIVGYQEERRRRRERWVGALRDTGVGVRFVCGPADPVSGRPMAERFRELVPGGELQMLDAAIGHYPQLEAPEEVVRALLEHTGRDRGDGEERS